MTFPHHRHTTVSIQAHERNASMHTDDSSADLSVRYLVPVRLVALSLALATVGCAAARHEPAVHGMPIDDSDAALSAVWVGHATVLLRMGRRFVLTDPNLGGDIVVVRRVTPASLKPGELPPLDVVVVSHLHADHFDTWTLRRMSHRTEVIYPRAGESYMDPSSSRLAV